MAEQRVSSTLCEVCGETMNRHNRQPVCLPSCGHSFCKACLIRINNEYQALKCPTCRCLHQGLPPEELSINWALMSLLEPDKVDFAEELRRSISQHLPGLSDEKVIAVAEHLIESIGVESLDDLIHVTEPDLNEFLKKIQIRKLLAGWKASCIPVSAQVNTLPVLQISTTVSSPLDQRHINESNTTNVAPPSTNCHYHENTNPNDDHFHGSSGSSTSYKQDPDSSRKQNLNSFSSEKHSKILKTVGITAAAVAGSAGLVAAAPFALAGIGFTSAGVAAGSLAASMMSAAGGSVAAGSLVALLQSAGAAGIGAATTATLAATGAGVGAGIGYGVSKGTGHSADTEEEEASATSAPASDDNQAGNNGHDGNGGKDSEEKKDSDESDSENDKDVDKNN